MAKRKRRKQNIIHKSQDRELQTKQIEPHTSLGVNSGDSDGYAVPAPLLTLVVLTLSKIVIQNKRMTSL